MERGTVERPDEAFSAQAAADPSFQYRFKGVLRAVVLYLQARKNLLGIEIGEAKSYLISRLILVCFAFICVAFGYGLALVGGIWWLSQLVHTQWWKFCLILVPFHFLLGYLLVRLASRAPREPLFQESRNELRKDKEWLSNPNEPWW